MGIAGQYPCIGREFPEARDFSHGRFTYINAKENKQEHNQEIDFDHALVNIKQILTEKNCKQLLVSGFDEDSEEVLSALIKSKVVPEDVKVCCTANLV